MSDILLTGIVTLDIINYVDNYPEEDSEVRAISQEIRRGGNASNTATVLSQLKHKCTLAATISNDHSGQYLADDLLAHSIQLPAIFQIKSYSTPTSYITLSKPSASRTIIHHRDLPELNFKQFDTIDLASFDWLHFEGRNLEETLRMLTKASQSDIPVSLELEKPRDNIELLIDFSKIIFISRPFAASLKFTSAHECLVHFNSFFPGKLFVCTWGADGASAIHHDSYYSCPAYKTETVIDTIGAGDTFIAGFIHAQLNHKSIQQSLAYACKLAGLKCSKNGLTRLECPDVQSTM